MTRGNGQELLIATRAKKNDPLRQGELVLPGGGLRVYETFAQAAVREVYEETGVRTIFSPTLDFTPRKRSIRVPELTGGVDEHGAIYLAYTDSKREYCGRLVRLSPIGRQEPREQERSDAKNPRYVSFREAFCSKREFTPACQALLEIIEDELRINPYAL